jgi:hypothetical protein
MRATLSWAGSLMWYPHRCTTLILGRAALVLDVARIDSALTALLAGSHERLRALGLRLGALGWVQTRDLEALRLAAANVAC